jgi:hypothetical protein
MKKYDELELEVVLFSTEDVIEDTLEPLNNAWETDPQGQDAGPFLP